MQQVRKLLNEIKTNYEGIKKSKNATWSVERKNSWISKFAEYQASLNEYIEKYPELEAELSESYRNAKLRIIEAQKILAEVKLNTNKEDRRDKERRDDRRDEERREEEMALFSLKEARGLPELKQINDDTTVRDFLSNVKFYYDELSANADIVSPAQTKLLSFVLRCKIVCEAKTKVGDA
jgi:DNA repair exonuclease SbcCD ATPase subunit